MKKIITKYIAFIIIFLLLVGLTGTYISEYRRAINTWDEFYRTPENSIDVLFLGNSHSYVTFNPQILNSILNIKSFNLGSGSQNIIQTYFNLREILKYQKPKTIFLELNTLYTEENVTPLAFKYENFDGMKLSLNKLEAMLYQFNSNEYIYALFPAIRNHQNWKKVNIMEENLKRKMSKDNSVPTYGYKKINTVISKKEINKFKTAKNEEINLNYNFSMNNISYLEKIIDICKKNNIELVFIKAPVFKGRPYKNNYFAAKKISDKYNIKHIDYNFLHDKLNLQNSHFYDSGHVNYFGATLITLNLSSWIKDNLNLETDFNNEAYNKILEEYQNRYALNVEDLEMEKINEKVYKFTVKTFSNNLKHAWYIYKNDKRIKTFSYSKENYLIYKFEDKGTYRVKYYIRDSKKNQNSGYYPTIDIN
ncbi:hypothetical protein [Anaeromicrobium sediminis]|uniref:Uncharacterized protein n=1 Tax=Anaeromicrobium sediminis TaxID=1478221 RepID=A0A267MFE8_9FIRM|nr:hypothetical protein [Anaeromicrobium sediminis]PAB58266.1 hypothetical protein CCE28_15840 [Anaeromicrobium sediminis]